MIWADEPYIQTGDSRGSGLVFSVAAITLITSEQNKWPWWYMYMYMTEDMIRFANGNDIWSVSNVDVLISICVLKACKVYKLQSMFLTAMCYMLCVYMYMYLCHVTTEFAAHPSQFFFRKSVSFLQVLSTLHRVISRRFEPLDPCTPFCIVGDLFLTESLAKTRVCIVLIGIRFCIVIKYLFLKVLGTV